MTSAKVIRYTTTAETAEENAALVREVYAELAADAPDGLRYVTFRLDDPDHAWTLVARPANWTLWMPAVKDLLDGDRPPKPVDRPCHGQRPPCVLAPGGAVPDRHRRRSPAGQDRVVDRSSNRPQSAA